MSRPYVTLKLATSLDGRIATASGESRWITGEAARAEVQKLRASHDAVMIGAGTAWADDPELLARTDPPPLRQPLRVVLDSNLNLPPAGRLFDTLAQAPLLVIGADDAEFERRAGLQAAGARVAVVPRGTGGVDANEALLQLAADGVRRVLVEGGGKLAGSLIGGGLVDRLEWFRAPLVLGGDGLASVAALAFSKLAEAPRLRRVAVRELGPDLWESYERAS